MNVIQLGANTPQFKNRFLKLMGKLVLKLHGWRFEGEVPNLSKFVMIGAPHTSNWDAYYGAAALAAMGIKIKWMAKHTLFPKPFRGLLTALGGIPINRTTSHGLVDQIKQAFRENDKLVLLVTPEGTRKRVEKWKTGFYRIAETAKVPILCGFVDYTRKALGFGLLLETSGDLEADLKRIQSFYKDKKGKNPELFTPAAE